MMNAGAQGLSDSDTANIAAYYAGAKCVSSLDAAKQATLQDKETPAKCAACHGADGNSTNPSWPNLLGLSKAYLVNSLKAYKGGARKNGMMSGVAAMGTEMMTIRQRAASSGRDIPSRRPVTCTR